MEERAFDALIADFYRAATGEIAWQQPLAGVQRAFNASFALLNTSDLVSGRMLRLDNGRTHTLLSNFAYPMWLLDVDRFIAFENRAAAPEVERGDRFARRRSGLAPIVAAIELPVGSAPVVNVPEPQTSALMLSGMAALGVVLRRRKTAARQVPLPA